MMTESIRVSEASTKKNAEKTNHFVSPIRENLIAEEIEINCKAATNIAIEELDGCPYKTDIERNITSAELIRPSLCDLRMI